MIWSITRVWENWRKKTIYICLKDIKCILSEDEKKVRQGTDTTLGIKPECQVTILLSFRLFICSKASFNEY